LEINLSLCILLYRKDWGTTDEPSFYQYIFTKKTLDQENFTGINFQENKHALVKVRWAWQRAKSRARWVWR
jgi:hypothetical protein